MLGAENPAQMALAADIAAVLEERDPLRQSGRADIALRLAALTVPPPDADRAALARIRRQAEQYRRRLRLAEGAAAGGDPAPLLAGAFPDRIAQRRGEPGSFRLSGGGGARLLAVAALELKTSARIRLAAPLDPADLPAALKSQISETVETAIDPQTGAVMARRRRRFGALILEDRTEPVDPATAAGLVAASVAENSARLPWTDAARQLQARIARMAALEPGDWPDFSDAALAAEAPDWLPEALARAGPLKSLDLAATLRSRLTWQQATRLD